MTSEITPNVDNWIVDTTPLPENIVVQFDNSIKSIELKGGLSVSREEFNEVVDKLNQVIKKVN